MADSRVQREAEVWVRDNWLPQKFSQPFTKRRLDLSSGGQFEFDGVSHDRTIAVAISTNGGVKANGGKATPKLMKIRADALFLLLAEATKRVIVFTDRAMFDLTQNEISNGRFPKEIDIALADLPDELEARLRDARTQMAAEVTPTSRA